MAATCTHGLVEQKKFGTTQRDGLEVCEGCGLPTYESMRALVAASAAAAPSGPREPAPLGSVDDRILAALTAIQRGTDEQNERLRRIWWALFAIWVPIILIFGSLLFGWFRFEVVIGPVTE